MMRAWAFEPLERDMSQDENLAGYEGLWKPVLDSEGIPERKMSIKDKPWFDQNKHKHLVLMEYQCDMEVWIAGSEKLGVPGYDVAATLKENGPIDIVSSPKTPSPDDLRNAFLTMCREKILGEVASWNALSKKMLEDKVVTEEPAVTFDQVVGFLGKDQSVKAVSAPEGGEQGNIGSVPPG